MATPNASSSSNPPKPTNAILHNAATPQPHLAAFSSPAPRSVPSPAAQRTSAGKSPFNASTHAPSTSTIAAQNHPTGGSSASGTKGLLGSSPAGMFFDSPNAMQLSLSNLGNLGALDSIGMGITMSGMSGLNMGLSTMGRGTDEERRKRLEDVVAHIQARPGRVTPTNVKRLGERSGMTTQLEESKTDSSSVCTIAGGSVMVDVVFNARKHVDTVTVSYPTSSQEVQDGEASASKILRDSLSIPPGLSHITVTLDRFERNLNKLAKLDKLNGPDVEQTFNCFEAISGVYTSLRRLFENEKKAAMLLLKSAGDRDAAAEREVMCKHSGRPVMNARHEIGMKIDYWMQHRRVQRKQPNPKSAPDSEGDHAMNDEQSPTLDEEEEEGLYSISVECEASIPEMYPPARVSNAWISDQIEKPGEEQANVYGSAIDWLDPPPTYLAKLNASEPAAIETQILPSIRFVAKLNPPLLLPLNEANQLLTSLGVTQESTTNTGPVAFYDAFILHPDSPDAAVASSLNALEREAKTERSVLVKEDHATETCRTHANSLFVKKPQYARYIKEFPFVHPKDLIQLLPILRQYAFVTELLGKSFSPRKQIPNIPKGTGKPLPVDVSLSGYTKLSVFFPPLGLQSGSASPSPLDSELTLDDLLSNGVSDKGKTPAHLSQSSISITLDVHPNAGIEVVGQNIVDVTPPTNLASGEAAESNNDHDGQNDAGRNIVQKLQNGLDVCGDIGIWVEWVRRNIQRMT